jgi:hypothetical protein
MLPVDWKAAVGPENERKEDDRLAVGKGDRLQDMKTIDDQKSQDGRGRGAMRDEQSEDWAEARERGRVCRLTSHSVGITKVIEAECSASCAGGARSIRLDGMDGSRRGRVLVEWISVMGEREAGHAGEQPLALLTGRIEGHRVASKGADESQVTVCAAWVRKQVSNKPS